MGTHKGHSSVSQTKNIILEGDTRGYFSTGRVQTNTCNTLCYPAGRVPQDMARRPPACSPRSLTGILHSVLGAWKHRRRGLRQCTTLCTMQMLKKNRIQATNPLNTTMWNEYVGRGLGGRGKLAEGWEDMGPPICAATIFSGYCREGMGLL